jgi:hypothetical protein
MKYINQKENKMEITKSEYIKLKVSDAKLNQLEITVVCVNIMMTSKSAYIAPMIQIMRVF